MFADVLDLAMPVNNISRRMEMTYSMLPLLLKTQHGLEEAYIYFLDSESRQGNISNLIVCPSFHFLLVWSRKVDT